MTISTEKLYQQGQRPPRGKDLLEPEEEKDSIYCGLIVTVWIFVYVLK